MQHASPPRRTQAERREATTAKLIDATIDRLAELGYARTSVAAICEQAGVSSGALFRHFPTRQDLIAAAADTLSRRHFALFADGAPDLDPSDRRGLARLIRAITRTPTHAAWREIMVAARTDPELRAQARAGLQRFETILVEAAAALLGVPRAAADRVAVVVLSIMHMFDSEAVTTTVYDNEPLEQARIDWVAELLDRELAPLGV